MGELKTINGAWSEQDNAWVSDTLAMTTDFWLEVELPSQGRVVIKKSNTPDGPWPKILITPWTGPKFEIDVSINEEIRYYRIYTTEPPTRIQLYEEERI